VWNAAFHDSGDFLASCSLDHSARLWDLHSNRCRATFRGHVDSVNEVCWQPFTNMVATVRPSADLARHLIIQVYRIQWHPTLISYNVASNICQDTTGLAIFHVLNLRFLRSRVSMT